MSLINGQAAEASDFIDSSEIDVTPSNDNGRVPKLENVDGEDAKIDRIFLPGFMTRVFTSSGSFTIPEGVYRIKIRLWGGGGAGQGGSDTDSNDNQNRRGGYGGAYREAIFEVTPGDVLTVTIGAASSGDGNDSTIVHSTDAALLSVTARGGKAGGNSTSAIDTGSATGTALIANTTFGLLPGGGNSGDTNSWGGGGLGAFGGPKGGISATPNNSGSTSGGSGEAGLGIIEY